jgi:hypothetical protein
MPRHSLYTDAGSVCARSPEARPGVPTGPGAMGQQSGVAAKTAHQLRSTPGGATDAPRRTGLWWLVELNLRAGLCSGVLVMAFAAASMAMPKVMVIIEEKVAGIFGTTGWETVGQAESTLAEKFLAAGFPVVDPQTVHRNIPRDKALRLLEGDQQAAAVAGLQFGAQVVITGQAISKNAGGRLLGTNMQSIQATVQVRAVRSDDGQVIATRSAQAAQAHIDELQGGVLAIQEASRELAETLVRDVLQSWQGEPAVVPSRSP